MARITRVTAIPFGLTGTTDDFETFGSTALGSTVYSKDIAAIQATAPWSSGWRAALIASKAPVLQDMNAKMLVDSNFLCYLFQDGVPEYDSGTTYYKGGVVKNLANTGYVEFYFSLTDSNTGNALPTRTNSANWAFLYAVNTTALGLIVPGTQTNDAAAAGNVGQYVESVIPIGSLVPLGSATWTNITSISLTAGDWDVTSQGILQTNGGSNTFSLATSIHSGATISDQVLGSNEAETAVTSASISLVVPVYRLSLASTTTVYMKGLIDPGNTYEQAFGRLSARRVR